MEQKENKIIRERTCRLGFTYRRLNNEEGGTTIIMVVLFLILLTALAPIILQKTGQDTSQTGNFQSDKKTFYITEAGIQHAMNTLYTSASDGLDSELTTSAGVMLNAQSFNNGTYTVTATDNDDGDGDLNSDTDNIIYLDSVGTLNGESQTVRALVRAVVGSYIPTTAILTDDDLVISGNPIISGTAANIHTNGNLNSSGNMVVSGSLSASGSTTVNNPGNITGSITPSTPQVPVPPDVANLSELSDFMDSTFKQHADFILDGTGKVTDGNGTVLANLGGSSGTWDGWDFDPGKPSWKLQNASPADGMYYFDGSSAAVGSSPTGWDMTLVAEGHIEISGNPEFTNHKDTSDPLGVQNTALMSLYDLKLNGNANQNIDGLIFAGQQFDISGNPSAIGSIIGKGFATSVQHGNDFITTSTISGNITLAYNGGLVTPFPTTTVVLTTLSWQEL